MAELTAHVWVRTPHVPTQWPGLILDRRRAADGSWEAWVRYVERLTLIEQVVEGWVPYAWLTPATGAHPGTGSAYG